MGGLPELGGQCVGGHGRAALVPGPWIPLGSERWSQAPRSRCPRSSHLPLALAVLQGEEGQCRARRLSPAPLPLFSSWRVGQVFTWAGGCVPTLTGFSTSHRVDAGSQEAGQGPACG